MCVGRGYGGPVGRVEQVVVQLRVSMACTSSMMMVTSTSSSPTPSSTPPSSSSSSSSMG